MAFAQLEIELEFKGEVADEKAFVVSCRNSDYQVKPAKK